MPVPQLPPPRMQRARVLVTGANGHLGRRLLNVLANTRDTVAVVRSEAARRTLPQLEHGEQRVLDYTDAGALQDAMQECAAVVHLVGIINTSRANSFELAHEATCRALARAAAGAGVQRIVYLSIVGARSDSTNACLASKGRAEDILLAGSVPALILRLPMVLGEGDYASRALGKRARAARAFGFRMQSLEQPIYAGDVVQAIANALNISLNEGTVLELAGPESLTRAALTQRAAKVLGLRGPAVVSLPLALGKTIALALECALNAPPISRAMLGVLDHDDAIDAAAACAQLDIALTPLDDMLRLVLT